MTPADFDNIPECALRWISQGRPVVLATVIETWGSSPRPVGAQMVVSASGEMVGSVSGGCVEGAVVAETADVTASGKPCVLEFGVADETAFSVGLTCGGRISILLVPLAPGDARTAQLQALVQARAARKTVAWLVNIQSFDSRLTIDSNKETPDIRDRINAHDSGQAGDWFVGVHAPPLRLIVVGAVHIAQPLLRMASELGLDTVLVDPRDAFATEARFPAQVRRNDWPDSALASVGLDNRTAVITLSHDPKIDDPAIIAALNSDVFYLGCLGSKKTHAKRLSRLSSSGIAPEALARIHAPLGLNIGSVTPAEIALSALSELVQSLRTKATE